MIDEQAKAQTGPRRRREIDLCERLAVMNLIQSDVASRKITLAEAVRRLRVDAVDFTQREFAKACKISQRSLVSIETGVANPSVQTLEAIFNKFGMYLTLGRRNAADVEPPDKKQLMALLARAFDAKEKRSELSGGRF
ncbi:helix-turn-helix domain-containing protein [Pseudomonas sp. LA21]|uniref:helix-turn-helix transcriptional regulator n=1 Tax=Pseudomonas sp. LA21 TaxID=2893373 RepID=UPI001FB64B5F|nr:helix-turn-helix transcriptional regulator [Pseudomonas sp. LA21]MCJ1888256.1 helix-turn-helix domain-containing protein [Pseudomonas sp. LA21]